MSNTVYIAVGAPGCGKSSWWERALAEGKIDGETSQRVNMDIIRKDITGSVQDQSKNALVAKIADQNLKSALSHRIPVIYWDNTSAQPRYRKNVIKQAKKAGYKCVAIHFDLNLETILERNAGREIVVPEDVVRRMFNSIKKNPPDMDEGYDNIITILEDE